MDINSLLVRDGIGLLDVEASMLKIKEALELKAENEKLSTIRIVAVLYNIFDDHPAGVKIPISTLTAMVVKFLEVPAYQSQEATLEVENFIRSFPSAFKISRGRNGGVMRINK